MAGMRGRLVLASTPIGAIGDASPRLIAELSAADIVAAEDTRRYARLARELGVEGDARVVSYYDGNEGQRTPELLAALVEGATVVLVTDAGSPSVSDPGYRLVSAAVEAEVDVTVVPGPSAVVAALAVSGLPVDRFCFEGFLPRRAGERARRLAALVAEERTLVFFEAPHRLAATLVAMTAAFGAERPAAACRELTKTYEEVRRGPLGELTRWAGEGVRGEVTLVVHGAAPASDAAPAPDDLAAAVADLVDEGMTRRDAVDTVAAAYDLPRRTVYAAATARSNAPPSLG